MPVVAVVNRKGGSGKSTIATHIAAWCANAGLSVMLGDVDRQQSTRTWLRRAKATDVHHDGHNGVSHAPRGKPGGIIEATNRILAEIDERERQQRGEGARGPDLASMRVVSERQ